MKSERRHDLKTNELADWIGHLPEFLRKSYRTIIYVTVVVIVVAGVAYFEWYRKRVELAEQRVEITNLAARVAQNKVDSVIGVSQGFDYSNRLLLTADALDTASRNLDNPVCAALALNKRAEALRAELHYRLGSLEPGAAKGQINQAVKSYEKALEKDHENAAIKAMSKLGLGLCAEELGDLPRAQSIYQEIVANPDYQGTVFVPQAQERLETMAEYSEPVHFTKAAPVVPPQQGRIDIQPVAETLEPSVAPSAQSTFDANELTW